MVCYCTHIWKLSRILNIFANICSFSMISIISMISILSMILFVFSWFPFVKAYLRSFSGHFFIGHLVVKYVKSIPGKKKMARAFYMTILSAALV